MRIKYYFLHIRIDYVISIYLIIGKRSVLIDSIHLGDFAAYRFTLEYGFLFSFGEQWYLVVNILQHDVYSCLGSQLLSSIILVGLSFGRDYKTIVHISLDADFSFLFRVKITHALTAIMQVLLHLCKFSTFLNIFLLRASLRLRAFKCDDVDSII